MSKPTPINNSNREMIRSAVNGWFMLVVNIVFFFGGLALSRARVATQRR